VDRRDDRSKRVPPSHGNRLVTNAAMDVVRAAGPQVTYISWAESCSRSDHMARELGGVSHMVYSPRFGSRPATILFKYLAQWISTTRILRRERPDAVFVMTPPLFAVFPAFWYARRHRKPVVLDAHSAAFLHPRWRRMQWLQQLLCRRATTTLVHNAHLAEIVRAAGGHAILVPDVPVVFSDRQVFERPSGFVVAAVCSFNYDEPVAAMFAAAKALPEITFFVTGDQRHLHPELKREVPANVHFTGFLKTALYGGLLATADVVLTLTTRDHTMLRGAYEAIYQGTPVIVSDWPVLREAFPAGAAYANNTPDDIVRAIRTIQAAPERYRAEAARLREIKLSRWRTTRETILERIVTPDATGKACASAVA
jgi:glycosyltransferase involved in cell wall biosynthesis